MRRWVNLFWRGKLFGGSNRRWWAVVVEALFAAALFLAGIILVVSSITLFVLNRETAWATSWGLLSVQCAVSFGLGAIGCYWIGRLLWRFGVSEERRGAFATRASELEIVKEFRQPREDLPTVPRDRHPLKKGSKLSFRLTPSARNLWGLFSSALFSIVLVVVFTILVVIVVNAVQDRTSLFESTIEKSIGVDRVDKLPGIPWLAAALMVPIALFGGWAIYQFFRQLLKLTGIGPTVLEISDYPFFAGGTYSLSLLQQGRVRLKLLDVSLVCQEEATYDEGTDIRTEVRTVFEERLLRRRGISLRTDEPFTEDFELSIPEQAMHSFKSKSNRIQWMIVVTGQAKNWPRLKRRFVVSVYPGAKAVS